MYLSWIDGFQAPDKGLIFMNKIIPYYGSLNLPRYLTKKVLHIFNKSLKQLSWNGSSCPMKMNTNNPIRFTNNSMGILRPFPIVIDVYPSYIS